MTTNSPPRDGGGATASSSGKNDLKSIHPSLSSNLTAEDILYVHSAVRTPPPGFPSSTTSGLTSLIGSTHESASTSSSTRNNNSSSNNAESFSSAVQLERDIQNLRAGAGSAPPPGFEISDYYQFKHPQNHDSHSNGGGGIGGLSSLNSFSRIGLPNNNNNSEDDIGNSGSSFGGGGIDSVGELLSPGFHRNSITGVGGHISGGRTKTVSERLRMIAPGMYRADMTSSSNTNSGTSATNNSNTATNTNSGGEGTGMTSNTSPGVENKSYVSLEDALGKDLADSMGDSLVEGMNGRGHNQSSLASRAGSGFDGNNPRQSQPSSTSSSMDVGMDNIARQTRHSLSRLAGSNTRNDVYATYRNNGGNNGSSDIMGNGDLQQQQSSSSSSRVNQHHHHHNAQSSLQKQQTNNLATIMDLSSQGKKGGIVVVVEPPSNPATPAPQQILLNASANAYSNNKNNDDVTEANLAETTQRLLNIDMINSSVGRSSAPPQVYDHQPREIRTVSDALRRRTASSLQQRAQELRDLKQTVQTQPTSSSTSSSNGVRSIYGGGHPGVQQQHNNNNNNNTTNTSDEQQPPSRHVAEDLFPYLWDAMDVSNSQSNLPSRALAILGASKLPLNEVRSTCEAFGSLLYFRAEFCKSRGVILLGYHDLRSARYATKEMKSYLQGLLNDVQPSYHPSEDVKVMYCVNLNSSSTIDESMLRVSNLPQGKDDKEINEVMSSYGAVKSINYQPEDSMGSPYCGSYVIEFFDTQDANQALLEIQGMSPWGNCVKIEQVERTDRERKHGQDLLSLIARWRHGVKNHSSPRNSPASPLPHNHSNERLTSNSSPHTKPEEASTTSTTPSTIPSTNETPGPQMVYPPPPTAQLVLGPDGQYMYMMVNPQGFNPLQAPAPAPVHYAQPRQVMPQMQGQEQHYVPGPNGTFIAVAAPPPQATTYDGRNYYVNAPQQQPPPPPPPHGNIPQLPTYHNVHGATILPEQQFIPGHSLPVIYPSSIAHANAAAQAANPTDSSLSSGNCSNSSGGQFKRNGGKGDDSGGQLSLDIETVKQGKDTRTSLMVRNIPNKYTQSMLLAEFEEGGHGPGTIDFFYLPIDFRNKCNRGYAFVNLVDYKDIVSFHKQYDGKQWKMFNSDKICEMTYARIQGKMGMMKRFQNSALMEKDPEYRPVVFLSDGDRKGEREEFPEM